MYVLNTITTENQNSGNIVIIEWLDVSFYNLHIHSYSRKNIALIFIV